MTYVLAALALLVVFTLVLPRLGKANPQEVRRLVASGARLLDVRTAGEFASGHLPGAVLLPVDQLAGRLGSVGPKDRPVVVYCHSGLRSARAATLLRRAGYVVYDLGPMSRW